jgi:hypothetical protein
MAGSQRSILASAIVEIWASRDDVAGSAAQAATDAMANASAMAAPERFRMNFPFVFD